MNCCTRYVGSNKLNKYKISVDQEFLQRQVSGRFYWNINFSSRYAVCQHIISNAEVFFFLTLYSFSDRAVTTMMSCQQGILTKIFIYISMCNHLRDNLLA